MAQIEVFLVINKPAVGSNEPVYYTAYSDEYSLNSTTMKTTDRVLRIRVDIPDNLFGEFPTIDITQDRVKEAITELEKITHTLEH